MNTIVNYIKYFFILNRKYKIDLHARSIAYYMIASVASITIISIEVLNKYSDIFSSSVLIEIFQIISDTFSTLLSEILSSIQLGGFSIVLLFTIIFSAAKIINGFNKFSFELYKKKRHQNIVLGLISSAFLFIIIIGTILFELLIVLFGKVILDNIFNNIYILKLVEFIFELLVFFITINILYIYVPPEKMYLKNVYKGAIFSSLLVYIILEVFSILFNILYRVNHVVGITFVLSMFSFFTFFIYYVLLFGLVINYHYNKGE